MGSITEGFNSMATSIREGMKAKKEKEKANAIFDVIHDSLQSKFENDLANATTPDQRSAIEEKMKTLETKIKGLQKVGFDTSEALQAGKVMEPNLFQDEQTRAIKELSLQQKQQQLGMATLPQDLTPLSKEATPEEKSAFLDKLPQGLATNVQGLANYELDPTKISSLRTGERAAVIAATKMFDPSFDMKKYPQQQSYLKSMGSTQRGTLGDKINSANTLIQHMDFLDQNVEKLKNTNLKPANAIINLAKDVTGDPSITDYAQAVAVVNSELENLLTGVGATQEGLRARDQLLSKNAGYDQMKSAIRTIGHIMQARTHSLEQQYKGVMGKEPGDAILHADSKNILNRLYGNKTDSSKKVDLGSIFK